MGAAGLPQIRWKNPWLLMGAIRKDIEAAYKGEEEKLTDEFALATIQRYSEAWHPYESKILTGMCELTGLEFRQNIIDVYVAPFYRSFSDPLFLSTKHESDRIVEVLAHELMHRLLMDNTANHYQATLGDEWRKMFGDEHTPLTLNHIPVHAIMQGVFEEYIKEPARIEHDKKEYENYPDYTAAWDYVDKVGYITILKQLREAKYEQPEF
jgi:hypothetical protein